MTNGHDVEERIKFNDVPYVLFMVFKKGYSPIDRSHLRYCCQFG
jgi:hypothetical protein